MNSIHQSVSTPQLTLLPTKYDNVSDTTGIKKRLSIIKKLMNKIDDCYNDVDKLKNVIPNAIKAVNSITDDDFQKHPELMFIVGEEIEQLKAINDQLHYDDPYYSSPKLYEYHNCNTNWINKLRTSIMSNTIVTATKYLWEYSLESCNWR